MKPYFLHQGFLELASTLEGNENIYLGIRPYAFHAGNIVTMVIYPWNEELTREHSSRFGGILLVYGVCARAKGWEKVVPLIYGIDYETHDIPVGFLDLAESEDAFFLEVKSLLRIQGEEQRRGVFQTMTDE